MLAAIAGAVGNTEIAISVITLIELAHGASRADTPQRKAQRLQFIEELLAALPIHSVNVLLRFAPARSTAKVRPRASAYHFLIC
ncbi:MAG: hypothetical protein WA188_15075 [Terriglobales bacterium]